MDNHVLIEGIVKHLQVGDGKETIKSHVISAGYTEMEFRAAYNVALVQYQSVPQLTENQVASSVSTAPTVPTAPTAPTQLENSAATFDNPILSQPVSEKTNKKLVVIAVLGLVLVLGVGVAAATVTGKMSSLNPFAALFSSPPYDEEDVILGLYQAGLTIDSAAATFSVEIASAELDQSTYLLPDSLRSETMDVGSRLGSVFPKEFVLKGKLAGNFDRGEELVPNVYSQVAGSFETQDLKVHVDVEFIISQLEGLFIKFNRMPAIPFIDVSEIRGQWAKIMPGPLDDLYKDLKKDTINTKEQIVRSQILQDNIKKHNVLQLVGPAKRTKVLGESVYEYRFSINPETMQDFLLETMEDFAELDPRRKELTQRQREDLEKFGNVEYINYINDHVDYVVYVRADGVPVQVLLKSRIAVDDDVIREYEKAQQDKRIVSRLGFLTYSSNRYLESNNKSYEDFCDSSAITSISETATQSDLEFSCVDMFGSYAIHVVLADGSYCVDSAGYKDKGSVTTQTAVCSTQEILPSASDAVARSAERQINIQLTMNLENINKPVLVDIPTENVIEGDELIKAVPFLGMYTQMLNARSKGKDASIKANLNNLRARAEIHYDGKRQSYEGFCESLKEDAQYESKFGEAGFYCTDTKSTYVVESKLSEGYYCADSTGNTNDSEVSIRGRESCG